MSDVQAKDVRENRCFFATWKATGLTGALRRRRIADARLMAGQKTQNQRDFGFRRVGSEK